MKYTYKNLKSPIVNTIGSIAIGLTIGHYETSPSMIYNRIAPSVVTVSSSDITNDAFSPGNMRDVLHSTGTGFSYKDKKYIVTNYHVIKDAFDVKVTTKDGNEIKAKLVGKDIEKDIALLDIGSEAKSTSSLKPLFRCEDLPKIGEDVIAIGNPFGFDRTMTTGIISGLDRELSIDNNLPLLNLIQTDAAINPGNSGGPLLSMNGCVLGMNTAIASPNGGSSGIGFTIPINNVNDIISEIITTGVHEKVRLGVTLLPDTYSEMLGINGVIIAEVLPGEYGYQIGLIGTHRDEYERPIIGDIITNINGHKIQKKDDIYKFLNKVVKGDTIHLEVLRSKGIEKFDIMINISI
jgi:S1-C subfamily serine protease